MGFSDRISQVRADLNDLAFSKNPEQAVEDALKKMQQGLEDLGQSITNAIAAKQRTEQQLNQAQIEADNWHQRAKLALQKGDESLAREALIRRNANSETAAALKSQLDQQTSTVDTLKYQQTKWRIKLAEAQTKKNSLVERAVQANRNSWLYSSSMIAFERMEDRVLQMEARSQAAAELAGADLKSQFAMLESGSNVDDELEAMKAQLLGSSSPSPSQLPGTQTTSDSNSTTFAQDLPVDDELEALKWKLDQL